MGDTRGAAHDPGRLIGKSIGWVAVACGLGCMEPTLLVAATEAEAESRTPCEQGAVVPLNEPLGGLGGAAEAARHEVRALVIGDAGRHTEGELSYLDEASARILSSVFRRHRDQERRRYDLGLTVGDNFPPDGVETTEEHRRRWWPYRRLGVPFFPTLGDEDYAGRAGAQIEFTTAPGNVFRVHQTPVTWNLPCNYYSFMAGPIRFVAIDTDEGTTVSSAERRRFGRISRLPKTAKAAWSGLQSGWVAEQLGRRGREPWRIVYGHHAVFSNGKDGDSKRLQEGSPSLIELLQRYNVTAFIGGHDASLQHLHRNGIDYFVAGGGGGGSPTPASCDGDPTCRFAKGMHGFLEIEATKYRLKFSFFDAHGRLVYHCERNKRDDRCGDSEANAGRR